MLQLDLSEPLQRDYYVGIYDRLELSLLPDLLTGGDFVDVGSHIGIYSVAAAYYGARVLALEPNPRSREQLTANLERNGVAAAVFVRAAAAGAEPAVLPLYRPDADGDQAWSSLSPGRFAIGDATKVEVTTVDREVDAFGLKPALVKVDVEEMEMAVFAGMRCTVEQYRPALLCEVSVQSATEIAAALEPYGYRSFCATQRRLQPGFLAEGIYNAVFVPRDRVTRLNNHRRLANQERADVERMQDRGLSRRPPGVSARRLLRRSRWCSTQ